MVTIFHGPVVRNPWRRAESRTAFSHTGDVRTLRLGCVGKTGTERALRTSVLLLREENLTQTERNVIFKAVRVVNAVEKVKKHLKMLENYSSSG